MKVKKAVQKNHVSVAAFLILALAASVVYFRYLPKLGNPNQLQNIPVDFAVIPKAKQRMEAGRDFYVASWDNTYYKYSPGFASLFSFFPDEPALFWRVAKAIYLLFWIIGIWISFPWKAPQELVYLLIGISTGWMGLLETFSYGQIECVLLGTSLVAWYFIQRPKISGFLIGLLPMVKLTWGFLLIPFGIYYFTRKNRQFWIYFLSYCCACTLWAVVIPFLKWGYHDALSLNHSWYLTLVIQEKELFSIFANQSLWASITRLTDLTVLTQAIACVLFLGYLYLWRSIASVTTSHLDKVGLPLICAWLLMLQLSSPLGWHNGAQFMVGIPLAIGLIKPNNPSGRRILVGIVFFIFLLYLRPFVKLLGLAKVKDLEAFEIIMLSWMAAIFVVTEAIRPRVTAFASK